MRGRSHRRLAFRWATRPNLGTRRAPPFVWYFTDSAPIDHSPQPQPSTRSMTDLLASPQRSTHTPLATEQEAREVAEAAREKEWQSPSFVRELFEGSFRLDLVHPFPEPDPADLER